MNNRAVVGIGLGIAALLVVSAALGGWVALVVVAVLLVGGGLALAGARSRPRTAAPQAMVREFPVGGWQLPSADGDYQFFFAATIHCQFVPRHGGVDESNWASQSVLTRAMAVVQRYQPEDLVAAQRELATALGGAFSDSPSRSVWVTQVSLTLSDADRQLVERRIELRKKVRVWEEEIALEKALRAYLRDDALATPSNALIWWLAQHKDRVEDAVRLRGTFALLSSAVHESEVPPFFAGYAAQADPVPARAEPLAAERIDGVQHPVELLDRLVSAVHPSPGEEAERSLLRARLADIVAAHGDDELGETLCSEEEHVDNVTALRRQR